MNNDDILIIGDWVYEDGYGIVERIAPIYWDIYDYEIYMDEDDKAFDRMLYPDEPAKELGNLRAVELQIKRFCDYNGKPIKRNRTIVSWKEYARRLKSKDLRLIQKAQKVYPKEYDSFLKPNKDVIIRIEREYVVENQEVVDSLPDFFNTKILEELPKKFTTTELSAIMDKHGCPIKLYNPLPLGDPVFDPNKQITLLFYYKVGDYRDKHLLFSGLRIFARFSHVTDDDYGWIRKPAQ